MFVTGPPAPRGSSECQDSKLHLFGNRSAHRSFKERAEFVFGSQNDFSSLRGPDLCNQLWNSAFLQMLQRWKYVVIKNNCVLILATCQEGIWKGFKMIVPLSEEYYILAFYFFTFTSCCFLQTPARSVYVGRSIVSELIHVSVIKCFKPTV